MVDPIHFTNFDRTTVELEEVVLFSVLVAGKNATTTARGLETFLASAHWKLGVYGRFCPFECLRKFTEQELSEMLRDSGIGCYTSKGKSVYQVVNSNLNLRLCSFFDMEKIHGIGPKTSRFFIVHTRPNVEAAVLDTHILKYLGEMGYKVPKSTPASMKRYRELEILFIHLARKSGMSVADFDLSLWNQYRARKKKAA